MKRIVIPIALTLIACATVLVVAQAKRNHSVEAEIIALEKRGWEAWIKKDAKFFQFMLDNSTKDRIDLVPAGRLTIEQYAKAIAASNCVVKNYSIDDPKVTLLNPETALLVYRSTLDAICDGKREPSPVWTSVLFVKRGGKWLAAFHQDTLPQSN